MLWSLGVQGRGVGVEGGRFWEQWFQAGGSGYRYLGLGLGVLTQKVLLT